MFNVLRQTSIISPSTAVSRRFVHITPRRQGYIVLVPEIGEDAHAADNILKPDSLPAFNDITIDNCIGAIGHQAIAVEQAVKRIEGAIVEGKDKYDTKRIFRELDEVTGPLETTWGIAKALYLGNSTTIPTKSYMNIHERARNARASKYNSRKIYDVLGQQETLVAGDEKRLLEKYLLEGKLNGLILEKEARDGLKEVVMQLGKERANYKNKVNMAVHSFAHSTTDFQLLRNFPLPLLEAISKDPHQPTQGPWKITLQQPIVEGFLKYCPDRTQRWNVWQANVRKASGQLEKSLENSTHVERIRALRNRQANILGFPSFAAMSMQTKMVKSVENLKQVFSNLLQHAGPAQSQEIAQLQEFATANGFQHKLELWDVAYWQRKFLHSVHQLQEEQIREFFPLPRVLSGLFAFSEQLFNIKIVERKEADVWQKAVKFYDIYDLDGKDASNTAIGGFYIDCYSKENRFGKSNGWMVSIRNRNKSAELNPLCALIFNFTEPVYGTPYLLNFNDLRMVFKTFGTGLQHLLTQASFSDLAGISNIEWDASQVVGNVLCNFLDNPNTLKSISGHYGNDEPIPEELAKKVHLLKASMAGYNLCQELYLADLDVELHQSTNFWLDVVKKLWPIYHCMPLDKRDSHPCSMTEIFSGDWAAAQFSHLYSKMIAADITDSFDMQGPAAALSTDGKRFKETFLASGGSIPTAEVFRRFKGRDPSVEALLKSLHIPRQASLT